MAVKLRKKKLANGDFSLYLDIYQNGKRDYEFLNLRLTKDRPSNKETLKLAENIKAKRQLEIQSSEHGFIPYFKKKANFVDYFSKLTNDKPTAEKAWKNTLVHLKNYTGGHTQFSAITDGWLEQFKSYLLTIVSQNTAHTYFSKIKAALNQAVKDKIIIQNPGNLVAQVKKQDIEQSFLTFDELQLLGITSCENNELKKAFLFACYTGLRLSDIRALKWENIRENKIEYRQLKTKGFEYLDLSPMARKLLTEKTYPKILSMQNTNVFNLPSQSHICYLLKRWCKRAGIDKRVTFHTSRHTFATLALTQQGADLYTVSKLLGHKSIQATQIYAKIVDEKKKALMDSLPMIEIKS